VRRGDELYSSRVGGSLQKGNSHSLHGLWGHSVEDPCITQSLGNNSLNYGLALMNLFMLKIRKLGTIILM
jgi:hypothetical protein